MMPMRILAAATLLIFCTAPVAIAQQDAGTASPAGLVYLDVIAEDRSGEAVRDLAVSDLEFLVDGQPAAIETVTVVGLSDDPPPPLVRGRLAPDQVAYDVLRNDDAVERYLAIVLDDIVAPGETAGADSWMVTTGLDLARSLVARLGPNDRGTIFYAYMGRQQGLTADRNRLQGAIDAFARRQVRPADCHGEPTVDACVVETLRGVAEALPAAPHRRKAVVLISERAGSPVVVPPAGGAAPAGDRQIALRALHATNAAVYSVTPAGVGAATGVSLAEATGGRALVDTAVETLTDVLWRDSSTYYLVGVRPVATDGNYRSVEVRVARPEVVTRARSGYFAPGGPAAPPPGGATTPLEVALVSPHQNVGVPLGASVAVFAVPGRREAVAAIVTGITAVSPPGQPAWVAEVAATAFDPQWRPRASHRQTIEVTAPPVPGAQTIDAQSAIELLPGRYEIRVAVETGGHAGSVFVDVDVPEFQIAPLSASGAVVTTLTQPYAANALLAQTVPVTPTTRRLFRPTDAAEVLVRFYQGGRDRLRNLPVTLRIADAAGEGIIQGEEVILPSQFDEARSTEWRFALPLSRLEPGDYLLTVEATLADVVATRHVRFSVMP